MLQPQSRGVRHGVVPGDATHELDEPVRGRLAGLPAVHRVQLDELAEGDVVRLVEVGDAEVGVLLADVERGRAERDFVPADDCDELVLVPHPREPARAPDDEVPGLET